MGSVEPEELSDDWVNVEMPREEGEDIVTNTDTTLVEGSWTVGVSHSYDLIQGMWLVVL